MIISLIGYMGSGKSHISRLLSKKTGYALFDIDQEIVKKNQISIPEIFEKKGEIFFRKQEREILEYFIRSKNHCILDLGGGTPVYYDNMEIINQYTISFFLRTSLKTLCERLLPQKSKRPLIAKISDENLPEFVAKHLFERNPFYSKAKYTIDTDGKTPELIVNEIIHQLQDFL
jgi:shikimate kinase